MSSEVSFSCPHCDSKYQKSDSLRKHLRRNHNTTAAEPTNKCNEPNCDKAFFKIDDLRKHLQQDHNINLAFEQLIFNTMEEFDVWKKSVEQESNSRFVKTTGNKVWSQNSIVCTTYECHRSGFMRPKHNAEEINSNKLNRRCLAQIRLFKSENIFTVHFYSDHSHRIEIDKCPLSKKAQESVVAMLTAGLSKEYIVKMFEKLPNGNRDRLITIEEIKQISIRNGLSGDGRNHKDDAKSVHLFVEKFRDEVILYRPIISR
jgi:hypothetical protein